MANASDAVRRIVSALDDIPQALLNNLKAQRMQQADDAFIASYFDKYPEYKVKIPLDPNVQIQVDKFGKPVVDAEGIPLPVLDAKGLPTPLPPDEWVGEKDPRFQAWSAAKQKEEKVKQEILQQRAERIRAEAKDYANRRFDELGYNPDTDADKARDLFHEYILQSDAAHLSPRWQPTIYEDELPGFKASTQSPKVSVVAEQSPAVEASRHPRSAKAPQGVAQSSQAQRGFNPETLLPEGIKLDVAIAIAKQNAAKKFPNSEKKQQSQFYKEMEAQGIARDIVGQKWVDTRVISGWVDGEGGNKTRTVDQSKLEAMRAAYQQPVAVADVPQTITQGVPSVPIDSSPFGVEAVYDTDLPDNLYQQIVREKEQPSGDYIQVINADGHVGWLPKNSNPIAPVAANAAEVVSVPQEYNPSGYSQKQPFNYVEPVYTSDQLADLAALEAELTGAQPQEVVQQPIPTSIPIPDNVPPQNVNQSVYPGSKAVSTSSDLPPGGGGGGNYSFEGGEFDGSSGGNNFGQTFNKYPQGQTPGQKVIPKMDEFFRQQANTGSLWGNVWDGTKRGFQYSVDAGRIPGRTASVIWNRAPEEQYQYLTPEGRVGFLGGRVAGEIGHGTKQVLWNLFPDDFAGTKSTEVIRKAGGNRMAQVVIPYATTTALQLGSQTYNPFNLAQGGRVAGYTAINPDEEDPRISTTPVSEFIVDRGFLGKRGRLLPWEQFREERPDISYDQYQRYQDYLRNKDENLLRDITGGLVKGTLDGINGPEVAVMGYSVTPAGALAAAGTLLAGRHLVGRTAALRV